MSEKLTIKITGLWPSKKPGNLEAILSVNVQDYLNLSMISIVRGSAGKKYVNFPAWTKDKKNYISYYSFDSRQVEQEIKEEILRLYELKKGAK